MPTAAGARALERRRKIQTPARTHEGERILLPTGFVEVDREEEARLVQEERIHARDERLAIGILAREVPPDDQIGDGKESTVRTVGASDARFLTDPANPLIRAGGCIAGPPGLPALEPARVHVVSTPKERAEERDLGLGC